MAAKLPGLQRAYWLGTDPFGRDVASLLLMGARNSILVGWVRSALPELLLGTAAGLLAADGRGWVEDLVMPLVDFTFAFPAILSAIIADSRVPGPALSQRHRHLQHPNLRAHQPRFGGRYGLEYVLAARACGKGPGASRSTTCCPTSPRSVDRAGDDPVRAGHPG